MAMAGPVRLGVAPIAWTNSDLPELGGDIPLETCLAESRAAGYSGTETGVKFPIDPKTLGPILEKYELALVSGWFSGRLLDVSVDEEKQRLEAQLDCFAALGAPVLVYAETTGSVQADKTVPVARRPQMRPEDLPGYGEELTEIAEHMTARGVRMAYHPHMGTVVETDEDIDRLMQATGTAVGLLVDTGHVAYAGGDWLAVTERHAARVAHVHCKDVRPGVLAHARSTDLSFLDAIVAGVFTVPGDGFIDYHAFARLLAKIGYSGWIVVEAEQDPAKAPPLTYARMGHAHLSEAFTAAGFAIAD